MERRVIKFNLVGAICVLILIVTAIVGITVFTVKFIKSRENNEEKKLGEVFGDTFPKQVIIG